MALAVAPLVPYQMGRDVYPLPRLGAQSLTPVTQGTLELQAVLVGDVNQLACGQEVIQLVPVSHSKVYCMLKTEYPTCSILLSYHFLYKLFIEEFVF